MTIIALVLLIGAMGLWVYGITNKSKVLNIAAIVLAGISIAIMFYKWWLYFYTVGV